MNWLLYIGIGLGAVWLLAVFLYGLAAMVDRWTDRDDWTSFHIEMGWNANPVHYDPPIPHLVDNEDWPDEEDTSQSF